MSAVSKLAGVAAAAVMSLALASEAGAQSLVLKRVMLSSGGVGYFEHEAQVDGDATLKLTVPLDQVDDVLKSLVVYDDKGTVGALSLPGREPLAQTFKDLPFDQNALGSPAGLLNALRGAEISVGGQRAISGRVIAAEREPVSGPGGTVVSYRHRVTVFTDKGLQSFILEDAENLQFNDAALRQQVGMALAAMQANRAKDARTFDIGARGQGRRTVRVAYIVAVPLWKASYRLTLPADPTAMRAALQGWATIENMSGQDWNEVELTLVSGSPVTFRQALYQAYYVDRPQIPVEVVGRLLPNLDRGGVAGQQAAGRGQGAVPPGQLGQFRRDDFRQRQEAAAPQPAPAPAATATEPFAKAADPVEESEALTQVAYRFPRPVTVANGRTLSLPIIDRDAPAQRLAIYQPETHARHPLAAVRLANDGDTGLPPGVITLYERAAGGQPTYVGDARLAALPAGENRLLSYALDQKIVIEREQAQTQRLMTGVISEGALRYGLLNRQVTTYRVKGPAKEPRTLIVEQPRLVGWKLTKPEATGVEISEGRNRIPFRLPGGAETQVFEVVQEQSVQQVLQLLQAGRDQIRVFAQAAEFDQKTRDQLSRLLRLYATLDAAESRVKELDAHRNRIVQDQQRIRDNLGRVPSNSDLHRRYLVTMDRQETEIETLQKQRTEAETAVTAARTEVETYVKQLG